MSCKRKIYGENWIRSKSPEDKLSFNEGPKLRKSQSEAHNMQNGYFGNGTGSEMQDKVDILQSNEHKKKFAKLKTYFTSLSVRISPSRIGSTIRNSRFLPSRSCDNLLCNGSNTGYHGNTQYEADTPAVSSNKNTRPSWFIRSKPISLKFGKLRSSKSKSKSTVKGGGADLFGDDDGDDDDEDLFSITTKPTKKAGDKPKPRATSLLFEDEQEEEGDLFGTTAPASTTVSKAADSGKKKPVGGVSLFGDGGADLFAETKKKISKEEPPKETTKAKEPEKAPEASTPRKMTLSLFDDDNNADEGDLFAAPASSKKKESKPAEQDTTRKSRSKSKMLFEDEDVLFGGTPAESPPVDLFAPGSPVSPAKDTSPPKFTADKPKVSIKGATTSASTTDIFTQSGSDEDDGDLFSSTTKKPPSKTETTKAAEPPPTSQKKVDVKGATLTESSTDKSLLADKSDSDEDLFGSQKTAPPKEEEQEVKPKKPPGAISMFGGVDIAAAVKKRVDSLSPEGKQEKDSLSASPPYKPAGWKPVAPPATSKKPAAPAPTSKPLPKPSVEPPTQDKTSLPPSAQVPPKSTKPSGAGIGKLQASLAINPAALLPGAAPPVKEEKPVAVGFDQPVEATTLHTAQKDRAKIQTKRRPPTRHARRAAAEVVKSDDLITDSVEAPAANSRVSADTTDSSGKKSTTVPTGDRKQKQDLFGNDDLFSDATNISSSKSTGAIPKTSSKPEKSLTTEHEAIHKEAKSAMDEKSDKKEPVASPPKEEDDLFSSSKARLDKAESKGVKKKVLPDIDDDIFSSSANSMFKKTNKADSHEDFFTPSSKPKKQTPTVSAVPVFEPPPFDDDDIFSSGTKKEKSAIAQVLDDDDDDDIFAGSSVAKTTTTTKTTTSAPSRVPDDDDIFADASINKPKESKPKAATVVEDDDIFSSASVPAEPKSDKVKPSIEDDSDIFASASVPTTVPKVTKRPKKAVTKDEDLFKDDTDIFAGLPASKPKEKKPKTKKESKSIFKDDVDDIFAESASKPKAKKTTKKKTTTGGTSSEAAAADIFDTEAPNIFDDPLNAMK